jgi:hypothetical protein
MFVGPSCLCPRAACQQRDGTTGSNFAQTHSYSFVNFTGEQPCTEGIAKLKQTYAGPAANGVTVEVRAACKRKDAK